MDESSTVCSVRVAVLFADFVLLHVSCCLRDENLREYYQTKKVISLLGQIRFYSVESQIATLESIEQQHIRSDCK